ncbi:LysR substrate-binding domain-containing protein [Roseateles sp. MS654]|uniref:LysR substrate-binding domain-containing protein n=1 Tax=Roseateles sp. MS654 TaxID=3412685 RepID=UPI003C2EA3A4
MPRAPRNPLELVSLRQLRYFDAAVEAGSFHEAARRCSISQPALSEQIAALEEALGMTLFDRGARRAVPTPSALALHKRLTTCMGDLGAALASAGDHERVLSGRVRLGLVQSYGGCWIEPVVHDLMARWPDLSISLVRRTAPVLAEGVARGDLDLAASFDPPMRADLEVRLCFTEPVVAVSRPISRQSVDIRWLASRPLALLPVEYAMRRQIDAVFAAARLQPKVRVESDSIQDLVRAADNGCTAVINAAAALSLGLRAVARVDVADLKRTACLLRARDRYHGAAAVQVWEALQAHAATLERGLAGLGARSAGQAASR